jgi:hypothetical protein
MYLLIVIFGAYHGLVFLPVALSLVGPPERTPDLPAIGLRRMGCVHSSQSLIERRVSANTINDEDQYAHGRFFFVVLSVFIPRR